MNTLLPACLTPLRQHWPFSTPLDGAILLSSQFDPSQLAADDFRSCGIDVPPTVLKAVAKRQAEYLAGRFCARQALRQLAALDVTPAIGEDRAPQWPSGMAGSITHGNGWAGAVVAHATDWRGLGLDVEGLLPPPRAERLAAEILTAAELARLQPTQLALTVTLTFSLKESLFKALYPLVGKRFYFEHAELLCWSPDGHARLRLLTSLSSEFEVGYEVDGQFAVTDGQLLSLVAVR